MQRWAEVGHSNFSVGIYLLKVNNGNTRINCETCSKLTTTTLVRRRWRLVFNGVLF